MWVWVKPVDERAPVDVGRAGQGLATARPLVALDGGVGAHRDHAPGHRGPRVGVAGVGGPDEGIDPAREAVVRGRPRSRSSLPGRSDGGRRQVGHEHCSEPACERFTEICRGGTSHLPGVGRSRPRPLRPSGDRLSQEETRGRQRGEAGSRSSAPSREPASEVRHHAVNVVAAPGAPRPPALGIVVPEPAQASRGKYSPSTTSPSGPPGSAPVAWPVRSITAG